MTTATAAPGMAVTQARVEVEVTAKVEVTQAATTRAKVEVTQTATTRAKVEVTQATRAKVEVTQAATTRAVGMTDGIIEFSAFTLLQSHNAVSNSTLRRRLVRPMCLSPKESTMFFRCTPLIIISEK